MDLLIMMLSLPEYWKMIVVLRYTFLIIIIIVSTLIMAFQLLVKINSKVIANMELVLYFNQKTVTGILDGQERE